MHWFEATESHDDGTQTLQRSQPTTDGKWAHRSFVSSGKWNKNEWLHQWRNKGLQTHLHKW